MEDIHKFGDKSKLLEEAYKKHLCQHPEYIRGEYGEESINFYHLTYKEFINKIKTDDEFAIDWDVEIIERELTTEERQSILDSRSMYDKRTIGIGNNDPLEINNIPTKAIVIMWKGETEEFYEESGNN